MNTNFIEDVAPGPNSGLIEVLSYRTYPSLVSALREVVSNASDADASNLNISLSKTFDAQLNKIVWKLTFFDDGEGMTLDEFKNYLRLSGSGRRDRTGSDATPSGRPIIGMLGIGSLAIAPWANRVEILTKKRASSQVLHVQIPYAKFFNNSDIRDTDLYGAAGEYKYSHGNINLQNPEASEVENGFTFIDLIGLTDEAINELINPAWQGNWDGTDLGLLGNKYKDYLASTRPKKRLAFSKFPPLLRFMHRLALLIPVPYPSYTPVQAPPIRTMVGVLSAQCMDAITVQGVKLQRPLLILDQQSEEDKARWSEAAPRTTATASNKQPPSQGIVTTISETLPVAGVQIQGYIWGQNTQIKFQDLAGVQVRIKNVGIGSYNFSLFDPAQELDSRASTRASRAQAISGEILVHYSKELERALRGDREGFQESSPVYIELKKAIYKHVQKMYTKIDELAPSRQTSNPADPSTTRPASSNPGTSPPSPNAASTQEHTNNEPAADEPCDAQTNDPYSGASSTNNEQDNTASAQTEPTTEEHSGPEATDDALTEGTVSVQPPSADATDVSQPKRLVYFMPLNGQPICHVGLNELVDAQLSSDIVKITIRENVLPPGLAEDKVDQISVVAAALAAAKVAQENQIFITAMEAASLLRVEKDEPISA